MAYIYPYAGHNSNTVTTNNDDNQPITPHSSHLWISSTQPNQIATSALKTAGKSHFISFFSFRKTGAVVLLLIMTMGATAWGQGITWDGQHIGKYYSMCSNTPRNGPNNNNITNCTQCSVTQTITMSSDQDANGNMWFKAPAGCTLTITLSSYTFRSGGNPTNYDRLYIYDDDGPITNNWNNYTAVRDWYNGHVAQNGNGTDRNTYTSTTTGGWISLRYQNNRTGDQNNRRSSFTVTIECNCSSSGCSNATSLPCGTTNLAGTTEGAPNIPHGILGADASNRGAWYTFTGDGSETTITTTSASFDNCIVVARGSCNNLTLVAEIDGSYGDESYSFQTMNNVTYYVYIAYYESGNTTGTFNISRTCTTPPSNSTCATATSLPCGTTDLSGTTVGTPGTAHGILGADVSNYGVWYTFVGDGNVTTITSTAASGFDHEMDICSGSCNNLTLIAYKDAGSGGETESYTFQTTNGVTYYVYIAHYSSGYTTTGAFTISRTCEEPLCPPSDMCEITFELTDSYGDGWNGNAIRVTDVAAGTVLADMANEDLNGTEGSGENEVNTLTLSVCSGRELSFSWVSGFYSSECSYTVYDVNGDIIFSGAAGSDLPLTYTPSCTVCPQPTNVTVTDITNNTAQAEWDGTADNYNVRYRRLGLSEDFESGIPATWTTTDADGDGYNWYSHINTGTGNHTTHSGDGVASSESYNKDNSIALNPDNWLITPQVSLMGTISFWYVAQDEDYPDEHFAVYVSTTGTAVSDFTMIGSETVASGDYQQFTYDLSSYSGQHGYIAIRHFNVTDMFILNIDDFEIGEAWTNRNTSTNSITLTGLAPGTTYEVQVQADCDGALSPWTPSEIFTTCNINATIQIGN